MRLFGNICLLGGLLLMVGFACPLNPLSYTVGRQFPFSIVGAFLATFGAGIIRTLNKQQNS